MTTELQETTDFANLLTIEAGNKYPYCKGYFLLLPPEGSEVLECGELLSPDVLAGLIDRFAASFPGADRLAAASMWTMNYFSILMTGSAIGASEIRRAVPVALDDAGVCIRPESGGRRMHSCFRTSAKKRALRICMKRFTQCCGCTPSRLSRRSPKPPA